MALFDQIKSVRGVIFDLGETLIHLEGEAPVLQQRGVRLAWEVLQEVGLEIPFEPFREAFFRKRDEIIQKTRETLVQHKTADGLREVVEALTGEVPPEPVIREAVRAFFIPEYEAYVEMPGATEVLTWLKGRGYRVGLISNATDHDLILRLVHKFGFERFLDPILSSAGVGYAKPHPEPFRRVLEQWGLPPEAVAMVGDTPEADILGAKTMGMIAIQIGDKPPGNPIPVRPDYQISELRELI